MPAARIQPQGRVRVNWAHPFLRNADVVIVAGRAYASPFYGNAATISGNPPNIATPVGIGGQYNSSARYVDIPTVANASDWTIAGIFIPSGALNGVYAGATEPSNRGTHDRTVQITGGKWETYAFGAATPSSGVTAVAGRPDVVIGAASGGLIVSRVGNAEVTASGGGSTGYAGYSAPLFSVGYCSDNVFAPAFVAPLIVKLRRGWSKAERDSFVANPWQVLEGQAPMLYAASAPAVLLAMLEAGAAADGSSATVISAAAAAEAGAAADASQSTVATSAAVVEAGAGVDATAGTSSTTAANTETLAAADSISTGATTSAAIAEAGAAADSNNALSAGVAAIAESGAAIDSRSVIASLATATADTLTAADASSTSGAATGVSMAEAGSAAETTSAAQQGVAATSEAAVASDTPGATMATTTGRLDALTAADLQQTGGTIISASIAESGAVAEFVLASYMLAAQVTEGASASDWLACSFMGVASISESSPAIDVTSGRWITSAAVTDALAALEQTTAQLGGQLKPNPHRTYVGRPRIRSITGATRIRSM
jgi:hypothetical protein